MAWKELAPHWALGVATQGIIEASCSETHRRLAQYPCHVIGSDILCKKATLQPRHYIHAHKIGIGLVQAARHMYNGWNIYSSHTQPDRKTLLTYGVGSCIGYVLAYCVESMISQKLSAYAYQYPSETIIHQDVWSIASRTIPLVTTHMSIQIISQLCEHEEQQAFVYGAQLGTDLADACNDTTIRSLASLAVNAYAGLNHF